MICETLDHNVREKLPSVFLSNESYLSKFIFSKSDKKLILHIRKSKFCFAVYCMLSKHH